MAIDVVEGLEFVNEGIQEINFVIWWTSSQAISLITCANDHDHVRRYQVPSWIKSISTHLPDQKDLHDDMYIQQSRRKINKWKYSLT